MKKLLIGLCICLIPLIAFAENSNDTNLKNDKLFEKEILKIKNKLMDDILNWRVYCEPKTKVIQEIEQISKSNIMTANDKKQLKERIKFLNSATRKQIQFDCKNQGCDYGG